MPNNFKPKRKGWRFKGNEIKYIRESLDSDFKSSASGSMLARFEKLFAQKLGVKYAIGCNSGTSALHTALTVCDVGPGDELIVPSMTVVMCAYAPLALGARPMFADVDPDTFLMDPKDVAKKITSRTKAILTVHMYGQVCDMDPIMALAKKRRLRVIEDAAQCFLGSDKGRLAGTIGHVGCFSLSETKMISCNEGGVVITNDVNLATRARKFAYLGFKNLNAGNTNIRANPMVFQDPTYLRHDTYGCSYFMSEIDAAIARAQTERIDWFLKKRQTMGKMYLEAASGCRWFIPQATPKGFKHAFWTFIAKYEGEKKLGVTWYKFRDKFIELGGDKVRSSYALVYNEPSIRNILSNGKYFSDSTRVQASSPIYERDPECPNAEYLQPRLMNFTTNQNTITEMKKQAQALKKTIDYFGRS